MLINYTDVLIDILKYKFLLLKSDFQIKLKSMVKEYVTSLKYSIPVAVNFHHYFETF